MQEPLLSEAEKWLLSKPSDAPSPAEFVYEYIAESRKASEVAKARDRRNSLIISALGMMVFVIASIWYNQATINFLYYRYFSVLPYLLEERRESNLKWLDEFRECRDCPNMVVIPAGTFMMGSKGDTSFNTNETPLHPVTLSSSFAVSKYEITFDNWNMCVSLGDCPKASDSGWGQSSRPVINITWDDAKKYTSWLSRITGRSYRLLSEAEWEYVARAGKSDTYVFGNQHDSIHEYAWIWTGYESGPRDAPRTHPVGQKKSNPFGVYDIYGNVSEYVEDTYRDGYDTASRDGRPWLGGDSPLRILRGGSFDSDFTSATSSRRMEVDRFSSNSRNGFRIARSLLPNADRDVGYLNQRQDSNNNGTSELDDPTERFVLQRGQTALSMGYKSIVEDQSRSGRILSSVDLSACMKTCLSEGAKCKAFNFSEGALASCSLFDTSEVDTVAREGGVIGFKKAQ